MKFYTSQKEILAAVETGNTQETSARELYHTAFVSAVVGIVGVSANDSEEAIDGHGNITVLTHAVAKINNRSGSKKKIIEWLKYYCNIDFNTQSNAFEYIVEFGSKVMIMPESVECLIAAPFWEKLPNTEPDFDLTKEMERLMKKVDALVKKAANADIELSPSSKLVTVQKVLSGEFEVDVAGESEETES